MALTHLRAKEAAEFAQVLADESKRLLYRIKEFLKHNSSLSIDWAGDPKPAFLNEDVNGNLDGLDFSRTQLANAIGSLDQIRRTFENEVVSQGDHLGNLEFLASADA